MQTNHKHPSICSPNRTNHIHHMTCVCYPDQNTAHTTTGLCLTPCTFVLMLQFIIELFSDLNSSSIFTFVFFFHILHKLGIWILALKWTEGIKVSRSRYQVELTKQCFENFIRIVNQEIRIILYSSFIDPALTSLWTITATVATPTKVHTTNQTTASVNLNRKHKLKHWNRIWSSWL